MMNVFRFYDKEKQGEKMVYVSFQYLVANARPDLSKLPKMQSLGISAGEQPLYSKDILVLDVRNIGEKDGFWDSNLGQEMKEKGFDVCVVHISIGKYLGIEFRVYMMKDDKFVSNNEYYETPKDDSDYEEGKDAYSVFDTGSIFIRYLCKRGAVVGGNSYEHPYLLPVRQNNPKSR